MLDYQVDVAPLLASGLSHAEVAAHLSYKTVRPIDCSDARTILFESGAIVEDPVSRVRSGSLIDYYSSLDDGEQKSLLGWFISHCGSGSEIQTNEYPRSVQWGSVVAALPDDLKSLADKLVASAGGFSYGSVGEDDVSESVANAEAAQAEDSRRVEIFAIQARIENEWINSAIADGVSTAEDVRAAIKSEL